MVGCEFGYDKWRGSIRISKGAWSDSGSTQHGSGAANATTAYLGQLNVQAGTPLFALEEIGGWQSAEMVRRCAHLAADHLAPYAETLCKPLIAVSQTLDTNWSQSGN